MNDEKQPNHVYKKLNAARVAFHEHKLTKTGRNDFAHYSYFELSDFLPHALTAFDAVGLCGVVTFHEEQAELHIADIDSGDSITIASPMSTAALKGCHPVQNLGATQTYLRRYLWSTALELIESDPLDSTTGRQEVAHQQANAQAAMPTRPAPKKAPASKAPAADEASETWSVNILDVERKISKAGKIYFTVMMDDLEHPEASLFSETLASNLKESIGLGLVDLKVQPGKNPKFPNSWRILDAQNHEPSLEEEFDEKGGE